MVGKINKNLIFPAPTPVQVGVDLNANPNSISFGDQRVNSNTSRSFFLNNRSDQPVTVYLTAVDGFQISPLSVQISKQSSVTISVNFNPTNAQNYAGYINISPGNTSVYVTGKGVEEPKRK